jgi:hypothetical protein
LLSGLGGDQSDVNNGVLAIDHFDHRAFGGHIVVGARREDDVGVGRLVADVGGRVVQRRADLDPDEVPPGRQRLV